MKYQLFCKRLFALCLCILPYYCLAQENISQVSDNFLSFLGSLGYFFEVLFFSISFAFLIGALLKYKIHRSNPTHVTLIVPITLFLLACAFLILGVMIYLSAEQAIGNS